MGLGAGVSLAIVATAAVSATTHAYPRAPIMARPYEHEVAMGAHAALSHAIAHGEYARARRSV